MTHSFLQNIFVLVIEDARDSIRSVRGIK